MKINNEFVCNLLKGCSKYFPELEKVYVSINKTDLSVTKDSLSLLFDESGKLIGVSSMAQ